MKRGKSVKLSGLSKGVVRHGKPIQFLPKDKPETVPDNAASSSTPKPDIPVIPNSAATTTLPSSTVPLSRFPQSKRQTLSIDQQAARREEGQEKRQKLLASLSASERNAIEACAHDALIHPQVDWVDIPLGLSLLDPADELSGDDRPDLFDEFDINRAGQTYTVIVDSVRGPAYVTRITNRTRQGRLDRHLAAWASQYDELAKAYLLWKQSSPLHDIPTPPSAGTGPVFTVNAIAWHWHNPVFPLYNTGEPFVNQILVRHGLLSPSPIFPTFAVSIPTLETFRCLRLHAPRTSIQAFVKSLCYTHNEVYRPYLSQQMADVYDVYLAILRSVDRQVTTALGRDSPDWRLLHSCPPCQYKLEDEEKLEYDLLLAMDGGMSLKRFANAGTASTALFESDYFIPRADVNKYSGEVKEKVSKKKRAGKGKGKGGVEGDESGDDEDTTLEKAAEVAEDGWVYKTVEKSPADLAGVISVCVERWKANADDSKKGMFNCFDESGVFISVCRHGMILVVADMVASGEKAKYPLAVLAKLREVYPDAELLDGYDIGCGFEKTAKNSSLGPNLRVRFVIPAMHGYAHNRPCQTCYHPNYVSGTGLEDFETCERTFSAVNDVARTTRHATAFHRHQSIDLQFRQVDENKYAALGTFLLGNYRQALGIIENFGDLFAQVKVLKHIHDDDFATWLSDEQKYLSTLTKEPEETTMAIEYVAALESLAQAEATYDAEMKLLVDGVTGPALMGQRTVKPTWKAALSKVTHWQGKVLDLEALMEMEEGWEGRWDTDTPRYVETKEYSASRKYRLALEQLEKLVVQRLFELQKGHLENTGYKLRTHIAKHLKSRSETIRRAVKTYNAAASALTPPRAAVSFAEVLDYTFLGEFDLLRDTRPEVFTKPWADRSNRALMDQYYRLVHAKEEVRRLNVEVRRLQTWIRDEAQVYQNAAKGVESRDAPLAAEIQLRGLKRSRVNGRISQSLKTIENLPGFSGIRGTGVREGGILVEGSVGDDVVEAMADIGLEDGEEDEDDEATENDVDQADVVFAAMAD